MNERKRLLALLIGIGFLLTLFVSSAYIAAEADHDCDGEHCEICAHIAGITALLRGFALLAALLLAAMTALRKKGAAPASRGETPPRHSLVNWKVRLNN